METDTDLPAGATDRRTALKKAAAAAGVVAWTTPAVQVLSSGTAHAQTVTGCIPMLTVTLAETGSMTASATAYRFSPKCCSNNTSFPTVTATAGRPAVAPAQSWATSLLVPAPAFKCNACETRCKRGTQLQHDSGRPHGLGQVKCADGITTNGRGDGTPDHVHTLRRRLGRAGDRARARRVDGGPGGDDFDRTGADRPTAADRATTTTATDRAATDRAAADRVVRATR